MTLIAVEFNDPTTIARMKRLGNSLGTILRSCAEPLAKPGESCSIGHPTALRRVEFDPANCRCKVIADAYGDALVAQATLYKNIAEKLTPPQRRKVAGKI